MSVSRRRLSFRRAMKDSTIPKQANCLLQMSKLYTTWQTIGKVFVSVAGWRTKRNWMLCSYLSPIRSDLNNWADQFIARNPQLIATSKRCPININLVTLEPAVLFPNSLERFWILASSSSSSDNGEQKWDKGWMDGWWKEKRKRKGLEQKERGVCVQCATRHRAQGKATLILEKVWKYNGLLTNLTVVTSEVLFKNYR